MFRLQNIRPHNPPIHTFDTQRGCPKDIIINLENLENTFDSRF